MPCAICTRQTDRPLCCVITQHFDCMLHSSLSKALACERLQELHLISHVGQYVYVYHDNGMFWNFSEILGRVL